MIITDSCVECLWKRQQRISNDPAFLSDIRKILDNRNANDCSPYLVSLFNQVYEKHFGKKPSYTDVKKKYNDLVMSKEVILRKQIKESEDPLKTAFSFSRSGNYIDYGALRNVDTDTFRKLLYNSSFSDQDNKVYNEFIDECKNKNYFLLIADNCGEIVLDKLFLEQLKIVFPQLKITVIVRGTDILNDVTEQDAEYVGIDQIANVISNGSNIAGTIYELISDEAKETIDLAEIILAKGQGNYESLSRHGKHIYYSFLCKYEMFINKFGVPKFTGMIIKE